MNSELKAAVAELRRLKDSQMLTVSADSKHVKGTAGLEVKWPMWLKVQAVVQSYLAEHPADDDEPIDWNWLRKIGFQDMETGLESQDHVVIVNAWGMDFTVCNGKPKPETRGDVRRLAKVLGIELKERTDG